jgi:hypothetical protein
MSGVRAPGRWERGGRSSGVELQPSKLDVAGSNPAARSIPEEAAEVVGAGEKRRASTPGPHAGREQDLEATGLGGKKQRARSEAGFIPAERRGVPGGATQHTLDKIENAHVAQSAERVLGKDEVISSILIVGSNLAGEEASQE